MILTRAAIALGGVGEAALSALGAVWPSVSQGRVVGETVHRPWRLPDGPWLMAQTWCDLLFAHWPVPMDVLRPLVPEPLPIDTYEGTAWLGVTPFELRYLRLRGTLPPPGVSRFPEVNVRTYTSLDGRPGIWFFSLDAGSAAAVAAARRIYRLPYHRARMTIERNEAGIRYHSVRSSPDGPPAALEIEYAPTGDALTPVPGTLEHWLTERYCLYTVDGGRIFRADIHHPPWPLQAARATIAVNTMAPPRLALPESRPLLHFARRQDVVIWPLEPVALTRAPARRRGSRRGQGRRS
jgi:uncharacterized protein